MAGIEEIAPCWTQEIQGYKGAISSMPAMAGIEDIALPLVVPGCIGDVVGFAMMHCVKIAVFAVFA